MNKQFQEDIINGLTAHPKTLPSKYFYDAKGDQLFVQIMNMKEYYLTNCEMDIFQNKTNELIQQLQLSTDIGFDLIELGAGDGTKTQHLLQALIHQNFDFVYHPVDISQHALDELEQRLNYELPKLNIRKQQGDYFNILSTFGDTKRPKIILFLGSNIGNYEDQEAADFMTKAGKFMKSDDRILVGIDLIKPKEIVLPAYSDAGGITAQFNLNLLKRINAELDANFDLEAFYHLATYEEDEGIARSYIVSKIQQTVQIKETGHSIHFEEGERIYTEISRKYNDAILAQILAESDLNIHSKILDKKGYFADYVLTKNESLK